MKRSLIVTLVALVAAIVVVTAKSNAVTRALAVIACATSTPCTGGNNTGAGAGISGASKSSHGVIGQTSFNSTGTSNGESAVFGQDLSTTGAFDMGVQGTSTRGYGVRGKSQSNIGVRGDSTSSYGLEGVSTNFYGVSGSGIGGIAGNGTSVGIYGSGAYGVEAFGSTGGAIYASTTGGNAIYANTNGTSVWALVAQSLHGSGVQVTGGSRGIDSTGGYSGVVARSPQYPLIAADPSGTILFYIDENGNLYTKGTVSSASAIRDTVTSYARTTSPAIEDTGTAHLVHGAANVYLDPSFARSIDSRYGYQVFLTPGGDTRGLYVAGKYARGFTVREVEGGRSSFNFDYHVYAHTQTPENRQPLPALPLPTHVLAPASLPVPGRP